MRLDDGPHLDVAAELIKFMLPFLTEKARESGDVSGVRSNAIDWLNHYRSGVTTVGDVVYLDGDKSIKAHVTGINWRGSGVQFELSYVVNGDLKSGWVDEWRVKKEQK